MLASIRQWTWPECVFTGPAWKQMSPTTSNGAWHVLKAATLPVETLHPHEVPPGPWVKIGVDFFQDHLGKKHLIVQITSVSSHTCFQWHPVIISRPSATYENFLQLKVYQPSLCLTTDLPSMEMSLGNFPVTLISFIPHHHHTFINRMVSSSLW